jgi:hypothetical protein
MELELGDVERVARTDAMPPIDPRLLDAFRALAGLHLQAVQTLSADVRRLGESVAILQDVLIARGLTTSADLEARQAAWAAWLQVERAVGALAGESTLVSDYQRQAAEILATLELGAKPGAPESPRAEP